MATTATASHTAVALSREALAGLIPFLQQQGYEVLAPVVRDGAIVFEAVDSLDELPAGRGAEQAPGRYRLTQREDGALFAWAAAANSPKTFFHPAEIRLFSAERADGAFTILKDTPAPKRAILGIRPCELAAIARQDRILLEDRYADWIYRARREGAFLVVANCTEPGGTCFCASMGTGPGVGPDAGYDIALTETAERGSHHFLAEAGSERGADALAALPGEKAAAKFRRACAEAVEAAAARMGREVDRAGLREALYDAFENPRWEQTAARCLACGNCTMACPTCFCVTVEDSSDVANQQAWRTRKWDSCFTHSFSYIHGGSVRLSAKSRYRQWLTHKFAAWVDQFGEAGCVGCGRCITWCPVGIDITEELAALRGSVPAAEPRP